MIDEQQQLLHPQQFDLAAIAVSCFWLLLRRTQQPGWPLRWAEQGRPDIAWRNARLFCPCVRS